MSVALVGLVVLLLGGGSAAWRLADQHLVAGGSMRSSSEVPGPQVALGTSLHISGTVRKLLRPGVSARVNLRFANRGANPVTLRRVAVKISAVTAPQADRRHPCSRADFRVRQMRAGRFVVPGPGFTSLSRLGAPPGRWPHLKMRNRPVNQDGCKGARLTLSFRGHRAWRR
jgi:hypothetical protein